MRGSLLFLLVLSASEAYTQAYAVSFGNWELSSTFPGGKRDDGSAFSLNGFGYYGCGIDDAYQLRKDWFQFDPSSESWTQTSDLPGKPRQYANVFTCNGNAYLIGGITTTGFSNEVFKLNANNKEWSQMNDAPFTARAAGIAFGIGDYGYYGSGRNDSIRLDDFWSFNCISEQWTQLDPLPFGKRDEMASFSALGNGYALMGRDSFKFYNDVWMMDPLTNEWSQKTSFPGKARVYAAAISAQFGGLIVGGMDTNSNLGDSNSLLRESWYYDAMVDLWKRMDEISRGKRGMDGFYLNRKAHICGGIAKNFKRLEEHEVIEVQNGNISSVCNFYPNPVRNIMKVSCDFNFLEGSCEISILNQLGEVLYSEVDDFREVFDLMDVDSIKDGLYYLRIQLPSLAVVQPFVVAK